MPVNMTIKIITYILVLFFNAVFLISGVAKTLDFQRFSEVLEKLYYGFPGFLYTLFAGSFLCFEFAVAICLWFSKTRLIACWAIAIATWFFIMVHIRIMLFFPQTNCNCYGNLFDRPATFKTLFENIGLFIGAVILLLLVRRNIKKEKQLMKLV